MGLIAKVIDIILIYNKKCLFWKKAGSRLGNHGHAQEGDDNHHDNALQARNNIVAVEL